MTPPLPRPARPPSQGLDVNFREAVLAWGRLRGVAQTAFGSRKGERRSLLQSIV